MGNRKFNDLLKGIQNIYNFNIDERLLEVDNIVILDDKAEVLVKKTMNLFEKTMKSYDAKINSQQKDFALKTSKLIFGEVKNDKVNLIPAKCGFGKSVLIKCAMKVLVNNLHTGFSSHHNEGAIIITDKIQKLEEFKIFIDGELENKKEHKAYLLKYTEKTPYETDEEYYINIHKQRKEQEKYPLLLVSSQRLSILNEKIEQYEVWKNIEDEEECQRTVKIIDEKPEMFDMVDIDNNFMNVIIDAIENIKIKDVVKDNENKNYLRKEILDIASTITELGNKLCDKQFDIYTSEEGATLTKNDTKFFELCEKYLSEYINNRIEYIKKLLIDEGGLFSNNIDQNGRNKRYFRTIGLKKIQTQVKTIIFDATSYYDMSYADFDKYQYIKIDDEREYKNLIIHNVPVNMAKWAIVDNGCRKLITCSNYLKGRFSKTKDIFLVTYKSVKYILEKQLGNSLNLIKLDNEIPSFGATKGKNNWNNCTTMIHLGFSRMREIEYISRFLSVFLDEDKEEFFKVFAKKSEKDRLEYLENFSLKKGEFQAEKLQKFMILSLLVDFEQEIFRTKIRDFTDTTTPVNIYVFNMYKDMINRVETRFDIKIIQEAEPIEFIEDSIKNRETKDGKDTIPQKILNWIDSWDGNEIKTKDMLTSIGISQKQFDKSKENNSRLKELLSKYMVKRGLYKKVS